MVFDRWNEAAASAATTATADDDNERDDEANVELSFTTDEQRGYWLLLFVVAKTHLRLVLITTSTTVTPE